VDFLRGPVVYQSEEEMAGWRAWAGRMAGMGRGGMEGGMGGWEGMVGWVVGWDGPGARPTQDKCDTFERGPKVCDFRCIGCQWEWCYENILRTELQPM